MGHKHNIIKGEHCILRIMMVSKINSINIFQYESKLLIGYFDQLVQK